MPTILLYSVPAEQHRQLEALGMRLGYSCKKIARKRFLQPIGCHAGLPGFEQNGDWYEGKDLPDPMILFSEFSDGLLNRFLAACKEDGMPQIDYRAVVLQVSNARGITIPDRLHTKNTPLFCCARSRVGEFSGS